MQQLKNPPWWDEVKIQQADHGERLIQTADFIQRHNVTLNTFIAKTCQALRRYDFDGYNAGLEEAAYLFQQYKSYCLEKGTAGSWYYEDQITAAMKTTDAPPYSFNGVVRRLIETQKAPNG